MAANLLSSNPYLRDPVARQAALLRTAASSSAVEGIRKPFRGIQALIPDPHQGAPSENCKDRRITAAKRASIGA